MLPTEFNISHDIKFSLLHFQKKLYIFYTFSFFTQILPPSANVSPALLHSSHATEFCFCLDSVSSLKPKNITLTRTTVSNQKENHTSAIKNKENCLSQTLNHTLATNHWNIIFPPRHLFFITISWSDDKRFVYYLYTYTHRYINSI